MKKVGIWKKRTRKSRRAITREPFLSWWDATQGNKGLTGRITRGTFAGKHGRAGLVRSGFLSRKDDSAEGISSLKFSKNGKVVLVSETKRQEGGGGLKSTKDITRTTCFGSPKRVRGGK